MFLNLFSHSVATSIILLFTFTPIFTHFQNEQFGSDDNASTLLELPSCNHIQTPNMLNFSSVSSVYSGKYCDSVSGGAFMSTVLAQLILWKMKLKCYFRSSAVLHMLSGRNRQCTVWHFQPPTIGALAISLRLTLVASGRKRNEPGGSRKCMTSRATASFLLNKREIVTQFNCLMLAGQAANRNTHAKMECRNVYLS